MLEIGYILRQFMKLSYNLLIMNRAIMAMAASLLLSGCNNEDSLSYRDYYNSAVKELSSAEYCGRSNYNNGDIKAAKFIIEQLKASGIAPMYRQSDTETVARPSFKSEVKPGDWGRWEEKDSTYKPYLQNFTFPLNVMRGQMSVSVDGKLLTPTVDYIVKEFSPTCKGEYAVATLDSAYYRNPELFIGKMNSGEFKDSFVVLDWKLFLKNELYDTPFDVYKQCIASLNRVGGIILKQQEQFPYFKARSHYNSNMPVLMVNGNFPTNAQRIAIDIESRMIEKHDAHNIVAYLPGKSDSETCITFAAHYDHLGLMGAENVFPGANDNASGVAMLLALAKYYSANTPYNNIQFMFLDAEETNLLGAFYYTENPYEPLSRIKYWIEPDMIGDNGDELICEISEEGALGLELLRNLNSKMETPFKEIRCNDLTDNSDHYPFALKHVPAIYLSVQGDMYRYYHTPRDTYEHTSDANFERLFNLLLQFEKQL